MPATTANRVPHVSILRRGIISLSSCVPHSHVKRMGGLVLATLLALTGCGYHVAGAAAHIPSNVRTLAVPVFKTNAQQFHTEVAITDATIRELNTRTRYRINQSDDPEASDAMLQGTLLTETVTPLTYDPASGSSSSYLVQVTAKVVLTAHDGRVLYRNDKLLFREQYQSTQDLNSFIQEDGAAVQRLSRDMASQIVSELLNSF